jgi:transcriptional regulator with XRE-family HTH domain
MGVVKHSPARIGRVIGARLKATREAMGMTQEQLSDQSGVTVLSVNRLEKYGVGQVIDLCRCLLILMLGDEFVNALTHVEPEVEIPQGVIIPGLDKLSAEEKAARQARIAAEAPGWRKLLQDVADMSQLFFRKEGSSPEAGGPDPESAVCKPYPNEPEPD